MLERIKDWKVFERLCADLLEAEGLVLGSEPSVDRDGVDFVATEELRSHVSPRSVDLRRRVQCKHYAGSGRNLGRPDVEQALVSYLAVSGTAEGLFLMVSSDYTEPAKRAVDEHLSNHPDSRVMIWNKRQIEAKLDRHPGLLRRYGLLDGHADFSEIARAINSHAPKTVLLVSDQSVMAHNLSNVFRRAGFEVVFLSFLNYHSPVRLELFLSAFEKTPFGLVVCFLGDSFGLPMPERLTSFMRELHDGGTPTLMFPFLAWSISKGAYGELQDFCPVDLLDPTDSSQELDIEQVIGDYRRGDFRWLLAFDSFAEDRYVEYDPEDAEPEFRGGLKQPFGLSHSFEFLGIRPGASAVWKDTGGNPLLVVRDGERAKSAYLNTCCHACMAPLSISSPLEVSEDFSKVLKTCLDWLLT